MVNAQGWRTLGVTGKLIIHEVCSAIDNCELFICDLTWISPNVLFELGYAIAKNKQIWVTLDSSFEDSKSNYDRLNLLSSIGYASYQNSIHLANLFFQEEPYKDLKSTIYSRVAECVKRLRQLGREFRVELNGLSRRSALLSGTGAVD